MKQQWVLTYIDWTFPFKMILDFFFFFFHFSFFWPPGVYSWVRRGFRWTHLYPSLPIGIWWKRSALRGEVEGNPCFIWFKCHTSCLGERDELLICRSQLSSQKSLSTLLQTTEKCHVRNLLFQSIRPHLCCLAKVFCEVETMCFLPQLSRLQQDKPEKILKDLARISPWHLL